MAKIALVSVTLNAVNPMTNYFRKQDPDVEIRNYFRSSLLIGIASGSHWLTWKKNIFEHLGHVCWK